MKKLLVPVVVATVAVFALETKNEVVVFSVVELVARKLKAGLEADCGKMEISLFCEVLAPKREAEKEGIEKEDNVDAVLATVVAILESVVRFKGAAAPNGDDVVDLLS